MRNHFDGRRVGWLFGLALLGLLIGAPAPVGAHEKWFVDPSAYPVQWGLLISAPVAGALLAAAAALGGLLVLRRVVGDPLWPNPEWMRPLQSAAPAVIGIQTAISLIYMAVQGWLFSPVLPLPQNALGLALGVLVILAALSFITGWLTRAGGAMLIGLVLVSFLLYPASYVLEQLLFVGIGLYFLILGRGLFAPTFPLAQRLAAYWDRWRAWALPALRIGTGASIVVLAFTEKLLNPALAQAFLTTHPSFNFMRLLGFSWFDDNLFILAAAVVETTVGVLLIAGVLPRVVILLMWVPFNAAIPLLPPVELLGHLPILAVMYVVFLQGPGHEALAGEPIPRQGQARPALTPVAPPRRMRMRLEHPPALRHPTRKHL